MTESGEHEQLRRRGHGEPQEVTPAGASGSSPGSGPGLLPVRIRVCDAPRMEDYRDVNRANWDDRVAAHAASPDYAVSRFTDDPAFLSEVVSFDRARLGDIAGLDARAPAVPHRHRHGLARTARREDDRARLLGARARAGPAPRRGRRRRRRLRRVRPLRRARCARPRALRSRLHRHRRALLAARHPPLGRGRRRPAATGRPALHPRGPSGAVGARPIRATTACSCIEYPYFEQAEPMVWDEGGTYVETDQVFTHNVTHEWNHGIGEIVSAVLAAGLELTALEEHDSVPWDALPGQMTDIGGGEYRLTDRPERLPHTYTLQARRPADRALRSPDGNDRCRRRAAVRRAGRTGRRRHLHLRPRRRGRVLGRPGRGPRRSLADHDVRQPRRRASRRRRRASTGSRTSPRTRPR